MAALPRVQCFYGCWRDLSGAGGPAFSAPPPHGDCGCALKARGLGRNRPHIQLVRALPFVEASPVPGVDSSDAVFGSRPSCEGATARDGSEPRATRESD